jgi:5-methylcytosine-specific restriction endonuclease McrA
MRLHQMPYKAKMGRKLPNTPRSKVRAALRQLWLRSRERASALKRDNYTCKCGKKQSKAKGKEQAIEVHHINGVDWEDLINIVYDRLLINPNGLETICPECHKGEHDKTI